MELSEERGGRRQFCSQAVGGPSGNRALQGSSRPRHLRRRAIRRGAHALSQGRGRQRRPGHGQPWSHARERATMRQRTSRRPMRSMRKPLSAAARTARSTSLSRLSRARGSTSTFLARLSCWRRPPTTARPARPTTSPRSSRAASAASRRAKRSPSSAARGAGLSGGLSRRGRAARRRARRGQEPVRRRGRPLRAVAADAGEARAELTGKTQTWTRRDRPAASGAAQVGRILWRPDRRKERPGARAGVDPMASAGRRAQALV